jgi:hypothetical protein
MSSLVKGFLLLDARPRLGPALSVLLGVLAFLLMTGGGIVLPHHTAWLMRGDAGTAFLGWQFFRHTPLVQLPLGANPKYGLELASSVVYSDSLPLFAIGFKPLSPLLPAEFQYFGLWLLLCFVAQSFFAYKLLNRVTGDRRLALVGAGFFALAPPFIARGAHLALCGQWVLVAGLYLYFRDRGSLLRWVGLLGVTALIHGYLLCMVAGIWVADLVHRRLLREMSGVRLAVNLLAGGVTAACVMWLVGYFMTGVSAEAGYYGLWRLDLLSLIDPNQLYSPASYSRILPDLPSAAGDYEGFAYLGLGMLALWLAAIGRLLTARPAKMGLEGKALLPLVLIVGVPCTLFAVTNHVAVGGREIYTFDLPPLLARLGDTFRASGRMVWPVFYLLYLAPFVILSRRLERRLLVTLAAVLLCVQVVDSSMVMGALRRDYRDARWTAPTASPFWGTAGRMYGKLRVVLPDNRGFNDLALARVAAAHGMAINSAYLARVDQEKRKRAQSGLAAGIIAGEMAPDSLYVFVYDDRQAFWRVENGEALWRMACSQAGPDDVAGIVDGYRIFAPGMRRKLGTQADRRAMSYVKADPGLLPNYRLGERVSFAVAPDRNRYLADGWCIGGRWGVWSELDSASVVLWLPAPPRTDLLLVIEGSALVVREQPMQAVQVVVNRQPLGTIWYTRPKRQLEVLRVPQAVASRQGGRMLLQFRLDPDRKSLAELGMSGDTRKLGLRLVSLGLLPAPDR